MATSPDSGVSGCTDCCFPRDARLLNAADFSKVFKKSRRRADQYWSVLVHDSGQGTAKLGLAIAKKRAKRAVDRNRLKRVAREAFRQRRCSLAGHHLVIMNRDAATTANCAELHQSLDNLLAKVGSRGCR